MEKIGVGEDGFINSRNLFEILFLTAATKNILTILGLFY